MFNKYFLFIFSIILVLILLEFNTDYKLINNEYLSTFINVPNSNRGTLHIITHNYEHKDILISFKHFEKHNNNFYMLFADKPWNYLLEPTRPNNIEFIYVKEKTVDKLSTKLLLGYSIIMFLYKESESTGPYYIVKNTTCPVKLLQIKKQNKDYNKKQNVVNHYNSSFQDIYLDNFMAKFTLETKQFNYDLHDSTLFMKQLKHELYA